MPPKIARGGQRSVPTKRKANPATNSKAQATLDDHVVATKSSNKGKDVKRKRKQDVQEYGLANQKQKSAEATGSKSPTASKGAGKGASKKGASPKKKAQPKRKQYVDTLCLDGIEINTGDSVYVVMDENLMKNWNVDEEYAGAEYLCGVCCKKATAKNVLLECSRCLGGFHLSCLDPPLTAIPEDDWFCASCEAGKPPKKRQTACAREKVLQQDGLCLARIESMWLDPNGHHEFSARWYCLPEETHTGRQAHNAAREVFLTQLRDINAVETILRPAHVLSPKEFQRSNNLHTDDVFLCEYEYDQVWQRFRRKGEFDSESGDEWSGGEDESSDDDDDEDGDGDVSFAHTLPGLKAAAGGTGTKGSRVKGKGRKKQGGEEFAHVGTAAIPEHVRHRERCGPLVQARDALTLAAVPRSLPCREKERQRVVQFVQGVLNDDAAGSGKCLYISGIPGTGKTATVLEVMRQMRGKAEAGTIPSFQFIEVNGLRLPTPAHAYSCILEALTGEHAGPATAMSTLERIFTSRGSVANNQPLIVLLDEMDLLVNKTQTVLYNLFDWPSRKGSKISIIGIANTMDLPERLHPRIGSRLGGQREVFHPYRREQLETIVRSRLEGIPAFEEKAITFVARKVANCSGDVRRCLELCRRAAEVAQEMQLSAVGEEQQSPNSSGTVTMRHVDLAIREAFNTCHVRLLREACRLERLVLGAVHLEVRYTGKNEVVLDNIVERLRALCSMNEEPQYAVGEILECMVALGSKRLVICDPGSKRLKAKIALNVPTEDLVYVMGEDVEMRWLGDALARADGQGQS